MSFQEKLAEMLIYYSSLYTYTVFGYKLTWFYKNVSFVFIIDIKDVVSIYSITFVLISC